MDRTPSLEQIHDDVAYYGENPALQRLIAETIGRMPRNVQLFALDRCCFVSVGLGATGITLPGRIGVHATEDSPHNCWIILLEDSVPLDQVHALTGHEVAHA